MNSVDLGQNVSRFANQLLNDLVPAVKALATWLALGHIAVVAARAFVALETVNALDTDALAGDRVALVLGRFVGAKGVTVAALAVALGRVAPVPILTSRTIPPTKAGFTLTVTSVLK